MSIYYQLGDEVLWNPSNRPGNLFHGQIKSAATILNVPSGLGEVISDEVLTDLPVYQEFVAKAFSDFVRSQHPLFRGMIFGFLGPALVLVDRARGNLPSFGDDGEYWTQLIVQQSGFMPR